MLDFAAFTSPQHFKIEFKKTPPDIIYIKELIDWTSVPCMLLEINL